MAALLNSQPSGSVSSCGNGEDARRVEELGLREAVGGAKDWVELVEVGCAKEEAGRATSDELRDGGGGRRGITGELEEDEDLGGGSAGADAEDVLGGCTEK